MASSVQLSLLSFLLFFVSLSAAQGSFRPHALVLPVSKDATTLQYLTRLNQRTPLVPVSLLVDLGGPFMWVDCDNNYVSSSYRPVRCRSAQCSLVGSTGCGDCFSPPRPGCNNNTCGVLPANPVTATATGSELAEDVVSLQSTDGSSAGRVVSVSRFIFSCASTFLLQGLAGGVVGVSGFGRTRVGFPSQFASAFSFRRSFAICLSSNGVIFLGDGPYVLQPNIDASQILTYTPLLNNREITAEYFIGVRSIRVGDTAVALNASLLSIDSQGNGGTRISTVNPYTAMETSIYNAFAEAFIREAANRNISRVASVAPFSVCFSSENVFSTRVGPSVPYVYLGLQSESVQWTITGSNSMVYVSDDVLCLGFVDGGANYRTSIVLGGHQLEDNFLQFDLARSRLGFSSILSGRRTTCSNFNFTSSP